MRNASRNLLRAATLTAGFLPALALAHPDHGETVSLAAGALHPVSGVDHIAGFIIVGLLAARLGGRYLAPVAAALLGLLVAAGTNGSEGWQYAAGFMLSGTGLVAVGMTATRLFAIATIAAGRRSPI